MKNEKKVSERQRQLRLCAIAETNGGRIQTAIFVGTLIECEKYMEENPILGYSSNTASIYSIDEYDRLLDESYQ